MKTSRYIIAAAAILLAASCSKEIEQQGTELTITASFADARAKTTLQDGGTTVYWEPGDEIKVFLDGESGRFASTATENVEVSKFKGSISAVIGGGEGYFADSKLLGLYPYRADATSDGTSITTTLSNEQTGRAGSFAKNTNITISTSNTTALAFYNVCGGVRFSVTRSDVKNVVFEALSGESVAGKVKLAFEGGVPVVKSVSDGKASITITAPSGGAFETGKWYYIVALPGTLSGGFKMTFNTDTKYAVLKSTDSRTIKRSKFGSLADADDGLVYKDKETPGPGGDNIVFKDNVAKVACVEKFDSNSDGELSYDEAAAVTSIAGLFTDYNSVTRFDELKYFTGITNLGSALKGLKSLKSTTIPAGFTSVENYAFDGCSALDSVTFAGNAVKTIGNYAFRSCTALDEITLPSAVESIGQYAYYGCSLLSEIKLSASLSSIGQYAFQGCSVLETIEIPSGVTSIPNYCFQNCSLLKTVEYPSSLNNLGSYAFDGCGKIESIDLPTNVQTIGSYAFRNCKAVKSVIIPNTVSSFGSGVFYGCASLESVALPSGITSVPSETFYDCTKLYAITFPSAATSIGDRAFYNCPLYNPATNISKIDLPETVKSIGSETFSRVRNVLVNSSEKVSIASNTFSNQTRIYVPDAKVENYKITTNWSNFADHIFPLSSYSDAPTIESVDLGLSVKWASCNIGAIFQEEYGDYYAWGETETKNNYAWSTYKYCNGTYDTLTKYCTQSEYGTVDNKTVLEQEDDVAHVKWGGSWRMPTDAEWTELRENCTWTWTTVCGVNGRLVTSNKEGYTDKSIFLPAAGYRNVTVLDYVGSNGNYWSSSLRTGRSRDAWNLGFNSDAVYGGSSNRCYGQSVRPVTE